MEKEKIKKVNAFYFIALISIFIISSYLVSAATPTATINLPASSSIISGTAAELNASLDLAAGGLGNFSCLFYAKSATTANSTWTYLGTSENTTNLDANLTSFDSTVLEDSNDYQFNVSCANDTNNFVSGAIKTSVQVNNTKPTAPTLSPLNNLDSPKTASTDQTFTGTVVDRETTSCTYTIARGGATSGADYFSGSGTYSGTSCTFSKSFSNIEDNGNWIWSITASDESDTTTTSGEYLVQIVSDNGGLPAQDLNIEAPEDSESNLFWWVLGIIVVLLIIVMVVISKM